MSIVDKLKRLGQTLGDAVFGKAATPRYAHPDEAAFDIENYPEAEPVRQKAVRMFTPLVEMLNANIPPDEEGRTYRLIVKKDVDVMGQGAEVQVNISRLNDHEAKSMDFFLGEGGWNAVSPDGIKYTTLSARTYNLTMPVDKDSPKQMYVGYAPVYEKRHRMHFDEDGTRNDVVIQSRFTRTNLDRACQGMMFQLDVAEQSRFKIMDWKQLRDAVAFEVAPAAPKPAAPAPQGL